GGGGAWRGGRAADTPILGGASGGGVGVGRGGGGCRGVVLRSTLATGKGAPAVMRATAASAACWVGRSNLSSFLPSRWVRRVLNSSPPPAFKTGSVGPGFRAL